MRAGSQAWPTAQRLGRCLVGVRRFESGPAHTASNDRERRVCATTGENPASHSPEAQRSEHPGLSRSGSNPVPRMASPNVSEESHRYERMRTLQGTRSERSERAFLAPVRIRSRASPVVAVARTPPPETSTLDTKPTLTFAFADSSRRRPAPTRPQLSDVRQPLSPPKTSHKSFSHCRRALTDGGAIGPPR